jgi:hypothetical protein
MLPAMEPGADRNEDGGRGTRYEVRGTRDEVQGTRYEVRGTRYEVQGTRDEVQGTRYEVRGTRYEVRGVRHKVRGTTDVLGGIARGAYLVWLFNTMQNGEYQRNVSKRLRVRMPATLMGATGPNPLARRMYR